MNLTMNLTMNQATYILLFQLRMRGALAYGHVLRGTKVEQPVNWKDI